jgi:lysophospholipase L1-like esterase
MQRISRNAMGLLLLFALLFRGSAVNAANSQVSLVIVGASYAADWKQPNLPGYVVTNRGVGGEETHQILARFDRDVLALSPGAVLIWGNINNIHRAPAGGMQAAKDRAVANTREMVARARSQGLTVLLATEVTMSEPPGFTNWLVRTINSVRGKQDYVAMVNGHVRDVNEALRTLAREQGLKLLDFEKVFDDGKGFRRDEYTREDGSHISAAGYSALTRYTQQALAAR